MPKVITKDYYKAWEEIPGINPKDTVTVVWPNGTMSTHRVVARCSRQSEQIDMFDPPDSVRVRKLVVVMNLLGFEIDIPLRKAKNIVKKVK